VTEPPALDGVLVVDKPAGPTSHDIVAIARRALRIRKIGHLGTLDPMASGVLPLVVGRATRLASLFAGAHKQYEAVIRLGLVTDSYDITGSVVGGSDADGATLPRTARPTDDEIRSTAIGFMGTHPQRPPPVSAKKVGGVRAYKLARRNTPVELAPVTVSIDTLSILAIDGMRLRCRLVCSSGFYVRSLAHDLGERLGCGACLETLRRERHGPFGLEDVVTLTALVEQGATASTRVVPMNRLARDLPQVVVTAAGARRTAHGHPLDQGDCAPGSEPPTWVFSGRLRVVDEGGRLLAIAEPGADRLLHPKIVLV
jgi:tRNA pseudouridine55 synthase